MRPTDSLLPKQFSCPVGFISRESELGDCKICSFRWELGLNLLLEWQADLIVGGPADSSVENEKPLLCVEKRVCRSADLNHSEVERPFKKLLGVDGEYSDL